MHLDRPLLTPPFIVHTPASDHLGRPASPSSTHAAFWHIIALPHMIRPSTWRWDLDALMDKRVCDFIRGPYNRTCNGGFFFLSLLSFLLFLSLKDVRATSSHLPPPLRISIHAHTHTHTHTYIYIYTGQRISLSPLLWCFEIGPRFFQRRELSF